jgi:hypothetical protein
MAGVAIAMGARETRRAAAKRVERFMGFLQSFRTQILKEKDSIVIK